MVEHRTGTPLTQVRVPGAANDFSPRVNFQCRLSNCVRTPSCAIACINICAHVKDPVVHVRVRWIMETLKHPARTVGWVARLCRSWLSRGRRPKFPMGEIPLGQMSSAPSSLLIFRCARSLVDMSSVSGSLRSRLLCRVLLTNFSRVLKFLVLTAAHSTEIRPELSVSPPKKKRSQNIENIRCQKKKKVTADSEQKTRRGRQGCLHIIAPGAARTRALRRQRAAGTSSVSN